MPTLLTDRSRLREIYDLRVSAWENSERSAYINHVLYPNGWYDELDLSAEHMVVKDRNKIIASIRINYYNLFTEHAYYPAISHIAHINEFKNFAYLSRLVVHHKYRRQGLSALLFDYAERDAIKKDCKYIALTATGFQIQHLKNIGFNSIGKLNTRKIAWKIEPYHQVLLVKKLIGD